MKEIKKHYVKFRLTDSEWQKLEETAAASGEERFGRSGRRRSERMIAQDYKAPESIARLISLRQSPQPSSNPRPGVKDKSRSIDL